MVLFIVPDGLWVTMPSLCLAVRRCFSEIDPRRFELGTIRILPARYGLTMMRIGLSFFVLNCSTPRATSSKGTVCEIERDKSSRPDATRRTNRSMSRLK